MHGHHGSGGRKAARSNSYMDTDTDTGYIHHPDIILGSTSFAKTHSDTCDGTVLGLDLILDLLDRLEVLDSLDSQFVCGVLTISSAHITD